MAIDYRLSAIGYRSMIGHRLMIGYGLMIELDAAMAARYVGAPFVGARWKFALPPALRATTTVALFLCTLFASRDPRILRTHL